MIANQPAIRCFNWDRIRPDLGALSAALDAHHETMLSPVNEIRVLAEINIAEECMAVIAGAAEKKNLFR